jgi:hypothetical protein
MIIPIRLDPQMFDRLAEMAARERRPLTWQAEVMLQRALGLSQPGLPAIAPQELPLATAQERL